MISLRLLGVMCKGGCELLSKKVIELLKKFNEIFSAPDFSKLLQRF